MWALFAAAAIGVGFGAAGLVGDPFTDSEVSTGDVTTSAVPSPSSPAPSTSRAAPSTDSSPTGPRPVTDSVSTRGGLVTGTCRDGVVRLSAAPRIGWEIDDLDDDEDDEAKVKFERVDDGDGEVEVRARCVGGAPTFSVDEDSSGPGSGSGDSGGSGGSGDSGGDD